MAKLSDMIEKTLKADVVTSTAAVPTTKAPKDIVLSTLSGTAEQNRVLEIGFIAKTLGGGNVSAATKQSFDAKIKAVGLTTDAVSSLPDGFTGTLLSDIQDMLNIASLFPMGNIKGGTAHELIRQYGITAFLTSEAADGDDSAEDYMTFVKTTKKIMAVVRKSYELEDDSLIDIAAEVRSGLVRSIAEGIEAAVINGDIASTHMDDGVAATSPKKVANGIRKHALNKATVDFGGTALSESEMYSKIIEMQLAGELYLNDEEVSKGNVVLVVDNYLYSKFRLYDSFRTVDKAGSNATLFGSKVTSVFNIPVISTTLMPKVDSTGVVSDTASDNTLSSCVMLNIETFKLFANGNVIAESDRNIINQTYQYTSSLRFGFSSMFDSTESSPNTVDGNFKNAIAGINIAR